MTEPEFLVGITAIGHQDITSPSAPTPPVRAQPSPPQTAVPAAAEQPPTSPAPADPSPAKPAPSQAYLDGQKARADYETWFNGLADGEYRNGALFWASHRSDKIPPGCRFSSPAFETGCNTAHGILTTADFRRKSEPDFKLGWNNP